MSRCYVCNASQHDGCLAVGGQFAECPRPIRRAPVLREVCVFPNCPPHCNNCPDLGDEPEHRAEREREAEHEYNVGQAADLKREDLP